MKPTKYLFFLLFLIFLFCGNLVCFAMDAGFFTEPVSKEREQKINISLYKIDSEPEALAIRCFDVNEKGFIAIADKGMDKAYICIYTNKGDFQYGYQFETSGDFGFEWNGDNIFVYLVRGNLSIEISPFGEVLSIREIQNTSENRKYWDQVVFSRKKVVDGVTYVSKNDMGLLSVFAPDTQLFMQDNMGNETLLYDVNEQEFAKIAIYAGLISIFILCSIFGLIRLFLQQNKRNRNE